ncbi:ribosome small subunit-dependent GTPase A [Streptomyces sp. TSRI0384-2]|uniref:Small ribosomal subunit biogenesis GTPase RsgA n=1 Tax=Streptomyces diastaticus subsp. diastaticus TaxID=68040 RepID=A0ABQ1CU08_STRDI|nr:MULTISPECIES: ribosome small subunit-dependent GTPase A [Streptomyces]NEE33951.1 ribosome small subunit-dependent GTPase A [Streptomyces sp. SID7982]WSU35044.1 ribosome small subunit-dependent GTPase A [Streptomyces gougerotii]PJM83761.1 ribosome small subunit-dependent GTPase A [Streptomyces sp. TSRI0384-2]GFH73791.1 putative ribosome biogenesis GTPase RsgA [Streptomyces diastaticus subsp. diastaticus]GGU07210.1 putative ribosome biogenesis GTPase RsgA [Streptomyces diastaticus subsp. dias
MPLPASSEVPDRSTALASPLVPYGWDDGWQDAFRPWAARGLVPGRVIRVDRGQCDVVTPDGTVRADTAFVVPRDPMKVICTGDWAALDPEGGSPRYVRDHLPRRTALVRSGSSKRSDAQVLAANIDRAVIAVSLAAELDLARIERFTALAWESGAEPLVVLTKADLVPDPATLGHLLSDVGRTVPGVTVLAVSSADGTGLERLAALAGSGTTVLLGQSGAGKSTLANTLIGREAMEVRAVRDMDGKGRHTTTTRNLLTLPGGGVLIDTPGLRGVGLWDAGTGVDRVFAEIEEYARRCRFQDCAHHSEPGCAVLAAVDGGELPARRLESYRKLQRENQRIVAKTDARLRQEIRREWRIRGAEARAAADAKRGRLR